MNTLDDFLNIYRQNVWIDGGITDKPEPELGFDEVLMDELTANDLDSYILLKYPEIAEWWGDVLKKRKKKAAEQRKKEAEQRKKDKDEQDRKSLLARLTPRERRLLGVK